MPRRRVLQAAALAALLGACGDESQPSATRQAGGREVAPTDQPTAARPRGTPNPVHPPDVPAIEVVHGPRNSRQVALTFQGAGEPRLARALLAEAERAKVRVTVFAVGSWLEAHPFMAHRILHGGHELGNHTYSRPDLLRMSRDAVYEEIARCAAVLRKLTGSPGVWFRPTGTAHATNSILAAAGRAGYARSLSYDVDALDWIDPGVSRVIANVEPARGGSVVRLHFGHQGTVSALPGIFDRLREKGLTPVTASELLGPA